MGTATLRQQLQGSGAHVGQEARPTHLPPTGCSLVAGWGPGRVGHSPKVTQPG